MNLCKTGTYTNSSDASRVLGLFCLPGHGFREQNSAPGFTRKNPDSRRTHQSRTTHLWRPRAVQQREALEHVRREDHTSSANHNTQELSEPLITTTPSRGGRLGSGQSTRDKL